MSIHTVVDISAKRPQYFSLRSTAHAHRFKNAAKGSSARAGHNFVFVVRFHRHSAGLVHVHVVWHSSTTY